MSNDMYWYRVEYSDSWMSPQTFVHYVFTVDDADDAAVKYALNRNLGTDAEEFKDRITMFCFTPVERLVLK